MSLPETYEEWRERSGDWERRARELLGDADFSGPRRRPRDPDEEAALRELGLDRWRPFARLHGRSRPAFEIRRARKRAGLSQAELAARMGVSQQQVQQLEDPDRSNPTWATLRKIAEALDVELRLEMRS